MFAPPPTAAPFRIVFETSQGERTGVIVEPVAQPISAFRNDEPAPVPATVRATNARFAGVWKLVDEESRDAAGGEVPSRMPRVAAGSVTSPKIHLVTWASRTKSAASRSRVTA